jgi:acyl carrier protein phosphodiesterase
MIGNFITDFLNRKTASTYVGKIKEGIALHRKIDQYTDEHKASLELRKMLRKRHGKYAPVVVDLIWDHYLCKNWQHFSGQELKLFAKSIYDILEKRYAELPVKLQSKIVVMIKDDFLLSYSNTGRMLNALKWMDSRVSFPSDFTSAVEDVEENDDKIQKLFMRFFPDLIQYVESKCLC